MRKNTQENLIAMKKAILDKFLSREISRNQAAGLLKMHPNAISRLKKRYLELGITALYPNKSGPKKNSIPKNRTPEWVENIVSNLAKERPDLGPVPLSEKIFDQYVIALDQTTIWRILKRKKIRYTIEYKRWVNDKPPKLYCLDSPGLELQMDGSYPFGRSRKIVCFDAIDDCSRFVLAKIYIKEDTESAIDFVKYLLKNAPFQRIQKIRVDNKYGKIFKEFCNSMGIEVIENDPYSPEQNGKIERFHKTIKREFFWKYCSYYDKKELLQFKLSQWLNYYNTQRRHGGYGMNKMTPCQKIVSTLFLSLGNVSYPQNVTSTLQQYKT